MSARKQAPGIRGQDRTTGGPAVDRTIADLGAASGSDAAPVPAPPYGVIAEASAVYCEAPLGRVFASPLNPRKRRREEDIPELARSIAEKGLLQPILCRPVKEADGADKMVATGGRPARQFEVILGARRLAACQHALAQGWLPPDWKIPLRWRDCSDDELVILAGVENFDREDMEPLDEAELFAAIRPRVTPRPARDGKPAETREAAVARLFHVSERTVFRRLTLMKCAEPVRAALRERTITLQQAQAFATGPEDRQTEYLAQLTAPDNHWDEGAPADILAEMTGDAETRIPMANAFFDPALYTAETVEDPETEERWACDRAEFTRLQEAAIAAEALRLRVVWPWVEIVRGHYGSAFQCYNVAEDDPEAGALIHVDTRGVLCGAVTILAPVKRRPPQAPPTGAPGAAMPRQNTGARNEPAPRAPLTQSQIAALHETKTQAIRRGLADADSHRYGRSLPLALAILRMAGAKELRGLHGGGYNYGNRLPGHDSAEPEQQRLRALISMAASHLPPSQAAPRDAGRPDDFGLKSQGFDSAHAAAWLWALLELEEAELFELFTRMLAERVGSFAIGADFGGGYGSPAQLGDSPLARAIAAAAGAEIHLPALWHPGEAWFAAYGRERLAALAGAHLIPGGAGRLKKAELVALCAAQPPGFWKPDHFSECRFQSETEAEAVLRNQESGARDQEEAA